MHFIFKDRSWLMQIPFVSMVKFLFLAQIKIDCLPNPLVLVFVFLLCKFSVFAYYVINCFISITTQLTLTIFVCIINFCLDVISPYDIIFVLLLKDSVSRFKFHLLNDIQVISYYHYHYFLRVFHTNIS